MKRLVLLPIALIALFTLSACTSAPAEPQKQVNSFEECVAAGNPVMESYPRQCRHGDQTFAEDITPPTLSAFSGDQKPCTKEYIPVCGKVQVQCIKAPCPPISTTFYNRCKAENAKATDIVNGICKEEGADNEILRPVDGCTANKGTWLYESNECEGISKEICEHMGGTFNECASACRNNPKAEICTMQCVIVCQF